MTAPDLGPDAASWSPPAPDQPPPAPAWRAWAGLRSAVGRNPIADCTTCGRRIVLRPHTGYWEHAAPVDPAVFCDRVEPRPDDNPPVGDTAHHLDEGEPAMTDPPDYTPAQLARQVGQRLARAATAAEARYTTGDRTVDDLIAEARYTGGVLDSLSLLLPATADPNPAGRAADPAPASDAVPALRAALDRILGHVGHTVTPDAERVAPDAVALAVENRVSDLHEKVGRAIHTGQQYAQRVDRLVTELEQAHARIAELEGNSGPASSPTDEDCGDPQCTLGGPHTHAEPGAR